MEPAARRRGLLAGLAGLLALAAYGPFLFADFRSDWESTGADEFLFDPSATSPALIVALAVYLAWRRRRRLARLEARPGPWPVSVLLLGLAAAGYAWAVRADAPDTLGPSLLVGAVGVAHLLGGWPALRQLGLPIFALALAIPIPAPLLNSILWKLQIWTAEYTGQILFALGQPGFVSGDRIHQAEDIFAIIETCSGLRTIQTLVLLAVLMADLFGRRGWHACLLLLLAPPIAFTMNGFRAVLLILVPGAEIDAVHAGQGIAMLLAGVLVLYLFDGLLERFLPRRRRKLPREPRRELWPRLAALAGFFGALLLVETALPSWRLAPLPPRQIAGLPTQIDGWRSRELRTDWTFYGMLGRVQVVHRRYARRRDAVDVFLASGAREARDRSLLSPKTAFPGSGWIVEDEGVEERDGRTLHWRVVRSGTMRRLVHHRTEGLSGVLGESLRTLLALDASPLRRSEQPLAVRLATHLDRGPRARSAAEARLEAVDREIRAALEGGRP